MLKHYHSIWDFDGPLARTFSADVAYHQAVREPNWSIEQIIQWKREAFKQHLVAEDPTHQEWQEKIALIKEYNEGILIHGGHIRRELIPRLREMSEAGWNFAIVTNGTKKYVDRLFEQDNISYQGVFDPILTIEHHPSKTTRITQVIEGWGIESNYVSIVTDTANDVVEALRVVPRHNILGVAFGPHTRQDLLDAGCIHVVEEEDMTQVLHKLQEIHLAMV